MERELVAKVNKVILQMDEQPTEIEIEFIGAKKLADSGTVLDLNDMQAVRWRKTHKRAFLDKFGGTAVVKDQALSVIIKYVPISHSPKAPAELRKIKRDLKLPTNTVLVTWWIKLIQR